MSEIKFLYPTEIPVHWGDQDALGHINNVMFIRYFETARVHLLLQSGIWQKFDQEGIFAVLGKIECNFLQSVHYPDTLIAQCGLVKVGNSSITVEHQLISKKTGNVVANGIGVVVCADPVAQKSVKIPDELKEFILEKLQ